MAPSMHLCPMRNGCICIATGIKDLPTFDARLGNRLCGAASRALRTVAGCDLCSQQKDGLLCKEGFWPKYNFKGGAPPHFCAAGPFFARAFIFLCLLCGAGLAALHPSGRDFPSCGR